MQIHNFVEFFKNFGAILDHKLEFAHLYSIEKNLKYI